MKRKKTRKLRKPQTVKPAARRRATKPSAAAKPKATAKRKASAKPKAKPADAVGALVTASAQALKLPLDPAWHRGVKFNLQLILRLAALVDEFPLPDDAEPGPVFHA